MGQFLDFIKNKKNLLSLLLLGIVVLAIPLGIKLIREQQIIKSRATSDPIVFTGPNVNKKSDGSWVALKPQISLEITSPFGLPAPSSPSATPTATLAPSPTAAPVPTIGEVSFVLDPMQASKTMAEEFNVALDLNAESFNISAVDVTVYFDKDKLELTDFVPDLGSHIDKIIYDKNPLSGYFRYAGARKADVGRVTGAIRLGAMQFKAKNIEGIAQVTFGKAQVTSSDRSDPLTVASNPAGSYTINPTPAAVTTVLFRIAENLSDLDAEAVKTPWQAYTAQPMLVDYGFKDKTAGVKTVFAQFKDSSGKTGGCGDSGSQPCQAQIKLLGLDPAISGCSLSFEGSNTTLNLTGQNFGSVKGTVASGDTNLSVSSWADSSIKAVWPDAPIGQTLAVVITNPDGQSAEGNCSAIAQLSVGARVFCSQPFSHQAANVNLSLVGAFDGGTKIKQNVSIDNSGVIQNLSAKLETGKNYVLSLKAPKSLRTNVCFTAQDGTTNISNFVLPVGDVFPYEGGDGQINSLDKAELNRQWNISSDTTGRSTDFNGDSRINTIDWACMRSSWNGADMSEPVPGPRQSVSCPAASLSSDVPPSSSPGSSPSLSPSSSPSPSPSPSPSSAPSPTLSPSPSPSSSPSPSPSPSASLPAV